MNMHVQGHPVVLITYWTEGWIEMKVLWCQMPPHLPTSPLQSVHTIVTQSVQLSRMDTQHTGAADMERVVHFEH